MAENYEDADWKEKYTTLLKEFHKNEASLEELTQENFNLKRELSREKETNKFVSDELEILEAKYVKDLNEARQGLNEKIERLSDEITSVRETNRQLEERNMQLHENLVEKTSEATCKCSVEKSIQSVSLDESHFQEFSELKQKVTSLELELHQSMGKLEACLAENKDLNEKIEYLESTLEFKKTEIQEKQEQEEVLQEKICELSMELNNLRMQPSNQGMKGNSLFAEVDDQRQKFRKLLNEQNDQYKQMKRAYQDGQLEIRRLRRENEEICEEMESCKSLFNSAESMYKQGLLDKIEVLEQVKENLQNKVSVLEEAIAQGSSTHWVNTMLTYCRNETKTLKEKLFECLSKKSAIEETLLRTQQECAKFKFEASELKTKLRSANEPSSVEQESFASDLTNNDIDDSVQEFLKELNQVDNKVKEVPDPEKIEETVQEKFCEPKYHNINILQEKVENVPAPQKPTKPNRVPIIVKKIVIPPRAMKK